MAKKQEVKQNDFLKIKNCETCKGNPNTSISVIPPFNVIKCEDCYEIVSYERIKPVRTTGS